MTTFRTPVDALLHWEQTVPTQVYLRQPIEGSYHEYTWSQVASMVRKMAQGMLNEGVQAGDRIAILAKNSAEWFIVDMAITYIGAVSVPIYSTANAKTIRYVLAHSGARMLFVGKLDNWEIQHEGVPSNIPMVAMPYPTMPAQFQWQQWLENEEASQPFQWSPEQTMTLIYTSGTTGDPKGAEISFNAYQYACENIIVLLGAQASERLMSYLPLAHITERVFIQGSSIFHGGMSVSFVESLDTFADNMRSVRPTLFISVPRLWAKFQHGVFEKLPPRKLNILLSIPVISGLIKAKIHKGIGLDQARILGCGSAPIAPSLLRWYERIGLNISEAWGMTENLAYGTLNIPFRSDKVGTIGKAAPGVELKISDDGEILCRCEASMSSYYLNTEKTEETIIDGWLHTGDKGQLDDDGYVTITGRIKESFKTTKGKYVAPVPIEQLVSRNSMIEQVCVVGAALTQPIALVVMAPEVKSHSQAQVKSSLERTLEIVNKKLESHERLGHIVVLNEEWNVENSLLTPTLKIIRENIENKFAELIAQQSDDKVVFEPK
ncbi:AMP-dependent synthetase [Alginatibacterium sediminis]|uniref:AMP-dependent synthetase n=1 Tax=Alginatibacterium sediminis TaxID=2164068 RepID=A0A420ENB4_9ALTE|nr:AMP-binding protein [Alginatibacterium sediminis]RKF22207.1 AMP-dependent synthetase [Alginatibacterium sediminis]